MFSKFIQNEYLTKLLKKTLFVLVGELVTLNPSRAMPMGFNVTTLGQKVTVYEGTVGLDVTRNIEAAGMKSHITDIDKKLNRIEQDRGSRPI